MSEIERSREREILAFGRPIGWKAEAQYGTIFFGPEKSMQFRSLPIAKINSLLENGYLDPGYRHNDAPPPSRLVDWASLVKQRYKKDQLKVGMIGYMVSPHRDDSRIALTGVSIRSPVPLSTALKQEVAREFVPDMIIVDDFNVQFQWD